LVWINAKETGAIVRSIVTQDGQRLSAGLQLSRLDPH
jgi:hypothetical protein